MGKQTVYYTLTGSRADHAARVRDESKVGTPGIITDPGPTLLIYMYYYEKFQKNCLTTACYHCTPLGSTVRPQTSNPRGTLSARVVQFAVISSKVNNIYYSPLISSDRQD